MIFEALDKIKRNAIFSTILLIALGVIVMICPKDYAPALILGFGFVLLVLAIVWVLNFLVSKKTLIDYVKFVAAVFFGIAGLCILLFRQQTMLVLALSFGILLILDGFRTLYHSFTFARRSHRKGWWILSILSFLLMGVGVLLFVNPWTSTEDTLLLAIGSALLFASLVSGLRLIWTWPVRNEKKEESENA